MRRYPDKEQDNADKNPEGILTVRFLSDFFASDLMMKIKKCLQPERVPGICMCETGHLRYGRNRTPPGTGGRVYYTAALLKIQGFF